MVLRTEAAFEESGYPFTLTVFDSNQQSIARHLQEDAPGTLPGEDTEPHRSSRRPQSPRRHGGLSPFARTVSGDLDFVVRGGDSSIIHA
jgi:hypothetical protein